MSFIKDLWEYAVPVAYADEVCNDQPAQFAIATTNTA